MRYILFLLLFVTLVCGAAVYMQVNKDGSVSYSDSPSVNAVQIDVPEGSTVSGPPPPPAKKQIAQNDNAAAPPGALGPTPYLPYTAFVIETPVDQQTFQNQRDIPIEFTLAPPLQGQDSIQLYVDGKRYRDPWFTPHTAIYQEERGTHTVYGELLDSHKKVIKTSNTITIYVHFAAVGASGGGAIPGGGTGQ
jgi:hypothetical protein